LPEVRAAFDELALVMEEPANLPAQLNAVAVVAEGLVPSTMAVSISLFAGRETWTMTAIAGDAVVVDEAEDLERRGLSGCQRDQPEGAGPGGLGPRRVDAPSALQGDEGYPVLAVLAAAG